MKNSYSSRRSLTEDLATAEKINGSSYNTEYCPIILPAFKISSKILSPLSEITYNSIYPCTIKITELHLSPVFSISAPKSKNSSFK